MQKVYGNCLHTPTIYIAIFLNAVDFVLYINVLSKKVDIIHWMTALYVKKYPITILACTKYIFVIYIIFFIVILKFKVNIAIFTVSKLFLAKKLNFVYH